MEDSVGCVSVHYYHFFVGFFFSIIHIQFIIFFFCFLLLINVYNNTGNQSIVSNRINSGWEMNALGNGGHAGS